MTPLQIEFLLHCYCIAEPHPNQDLDAYKKVCEELEQMGVIEASRTENMWKTTPRGEAWLKLILKTPCPESKFVDEHGNVIE